MLAVHASSLDRVERASTAVHQHEMQLFRTGKASFSLVKKRANFNEFYLLNASFSSQLNKANRVSKTESTLMLCPKIIKISP